LHALKNILLDNNFELALLKKYFYDKN
jgi:hypothetical protein